MHEGVRDSTPAPSGFSHLVVAAPGDEDELGHVSNLVYVRWIQDVARAHSQALGWDHDAYRRVGAVFVVRRHEIDYLAPLYAGDRVRLTTSIDRWSGATCVRLTRIEKVDDGRLVAQSSTVWAFVAIKTGRPRRVPDDIRRAFARSSLMPPSVAGEP